MPTLVRENVDNLNAVLTVTITRDDLAPKLKSELNKFRQKATLKGFRKGKTPLNFIKKMYGDSIMMDIVNKTIEEELNGYLTEEKPEMLGQPIPSSGQEMVDLSINGSDDLVFKFDLGLAPNLEVQGVDKATKLSMYKVNIPNEMLDEDLMAGRKRVGKRENVEDLVQEGDMIQINANEMDGDAIKLDGWPASFSVLYNDIADEAVKADLATKKVGDTFHFNIQTIEGGKTEEHIRKYLLGVGEGDEDVVIGDHFEGSIESVGRVMPADLGQEFFDQYFGEGKITNEEEARDFLRTDIQKAYDNQAGSLVRRDLQELLFEKNNIELPDEFLKRWLVSSSEQNTLELVEKDYANFSRSVRWTLMRDKLAKQFEVKVTHQDVVDRTKQTMMQYYGQYLDPAMMDSMAERFLQDEKQYQRTFDELINEKVFDKAVGEITITETPIEKAEFEEVIKEAQAAAQNANAEVDNLVTAEEEE